MSSKIDHRPPKHLRTLKRGDVREDGMIFLHYQASYRGGEVWATPEKYSEVTSRPIPDNRPPKHLRTLKSGHVREDGMVFCEYTRTAKNGEWWVTVDAFNNHKLARRMRGLVGDAIRRGGESAKAKELIGCSIDKLKKHLESQFKEGMTWENRGLRGWHIDHIKPCASFDLSLDEEQKKCFHYTNLQPLWAKDNLIKAYSWQPKE